MRAVLAGMPRMTKPGRRVRFLDVLVDGRLGGDPALLGSADRRFREVDAVRVGCVIWAMWREIEWES